MGGGGAFLPSPKFRLCKLSTGARGGLVLSPASPIAHRQTYLCIQNPHRPRSQKEQRSMPEEPLPRQVSTQQAGTTPLQGSLGRPWFSEDSLEQAPRPPPFPPPTFTPAAKRPPSSWPLPSLHRCSLFLICHAVPGQKLPAFPAHPSHTQVHKPDPQGLIAISASLLHP